MWSRPKLPTATGRSTQSRIDGLSGSLCVFVAPDQPSPFLSNVTAKFRVATFLFAAAICSRLSAPTLKDRVHNSAAMPSCGFSKVL